MMEQQTYGSTVIVRKQLEAPHQNAVALSQAPQRNRPLELNGTKVQEVNSHPVAILDTARRVEVISQDPQSRRIRLIGRNSQNALIQEDLEFPAGGGSRSSFFDYRLVIQVWPEYDDYDPNWTGAIQVGTNFVGSTAPQIMAHYQAIFNVGFDVTVEGNATCVIEATRDIPMALPYIHVEGHSFFQPKAHWFTWTTLDDITTEKFSDIDSPINAWRLTVKAGDGLCTARAIPIGLRT